MDIGIQTEITQFLCFYLSHRVPLLHQNLIGDIDNLKTIFNDEKLFYDVRSRNYYSEKLLVF